MQVGGFVADLAVEGLQPVAGCRAEFAIQRHPRAVEGADRVGAAARPVQPDHQMAPQPFLSRVGCDGGFDFGNEIAAVAGLQGGIEPGFNCGVAQRDITRRIGVREVAMRELAEWVASPQRQRGAEFLEGVRRRAANECGAAVLDQCFKSMQIDRIVVEQRELVAVAREASRIFAGDAISVDCGRMRRRFVT